MSTSWKEKLEKKKWASS